MIKYPVDSRNSKLVYDKNGVVVAKCTSPEDASTIERAINAMYELEPPRTKLALAYLRKFFPDIYNWVYKYFSTDRMD